MTARETIVNLHTNYASQLKQWTAESPWQFFSREIKGEL